MQAAQNCQLELHLQPPFGGVVLWQAAMSVIVNKDYGNNSELITTPYSRSTESSSQQ
jgi:hypothetical protein